MPWSEAEPLRVILSGASDAGRLGELTVAVASDAELPLAQIHHVICTHSAGGGELETVGLAIAHQLLDSESALGRVEVSVASPQWRNLDPAITLGQVAQRSAEVRHARVEVDRTGQADIESAMRDVALLSGAPIPDLRKLDVEWRYRKAAGISFRTAWVAVQKLILTAATERAQDMAELVLSEVDEIAWVRVVVQRHVLIESAPGVFTLAGQVDRDSGIARRL